MSGRRRVLVMGGTQFNGLALVHELVREGHDVTICNRGQTEADIPDVVGRLVADRTDHDQLRAVLGGTEWDCVHDMTAYHPEDVEIMIEIFTDAVGHYVFASSTVIYAASGVLPIGEAHADERGPDQNQYGLHKLLCEDLLIEADQTRGFPATTVPFSMVFGPNNTLYDREQRMFKRLLDGRPILVPGDGSTLLQTGHVEDQARALEQIMGNEACFGRRYNLTGRQAVTRTHYVETLAEAVGADPPIVSIPADTMDALWTGELELDMGAGPNIGMNIRSSDSSNPRAEMLMRRFQISQLVQHLAPNIHWWNASTVFDIDRIREDVGWQPEHDFASMVDHTYRWFQRSGTADRRTYDWTFEDAVLAELGHTA